MFIFFEKDTTWYSKYFIWHIPLAVAWVCGNAEIFIEIAAVVRHKFNAAILILLQHIFKSLMDKPKPLFVVHVNILNFLNFLIDIL